MWDLNHKRLCWKYKLEIFQKVFKQKEWALCSSTREIHQIRNIKKNQSS